MGLDSVEILVEVEKAFSISIPDREAEKILTVGDFHDTVWRHLYAKESERCKSQSLFYTIRRSLSDLFQYPVNKVQLHTSPNEIFPIQQRRRAYAEFAHSTDLTLPDLVLTKPWKTVLDTVGIITIAGGLAVSLVLINFFESSKWTLLLPLAGVFFTSFLSGLFNPFRTNIAAQSIREFTEQTLALNFSTFKKDQGINRHEAELMINRIIAVKGGLELEEISPEKRIGADLGID